MSAISERILAVGLTFPANSVLERLGRKGREYQVVNTVVDAGEALRRGKFGIVLAAKYLSDGEGYDLVERVTRAGGTLLVAVTLSEGYLWIPVVERGVKTLGERGLEPLMLEMEIGGLTSMAERRTISGGPPRRLDGTKRKQAKLSSHTPAQSGASGAAGLEHR
jgi:hypothetical protein